MAIPILPFVQIGIGLALSVVSSLLTPPIQQKGQRLDNLKNAKSNYGVQIPILYGTNKISSNKIWDTDIKETTSVVGGKGLGQKTQTTTYNYFANAAFMFCEGEILGIRRLWLDNKLVYNVSENAPIKELDASLKFRNNYLRIYTGTATQTADPLIQTDKGLDTPAYRHRAYVVLENLPLADYGNRIPSATAEILTQGISTIRYLSADGESFVTSGTTGARPITTLTRSRVKVSDILKDLCKRGGLQPSEIDTTEVPDTLTTYGYTIAASSEIKDLLNAIVPAFNLDVTESNGKVKFIQSKRPTTVATIPLSDIRSIDIGNTAPFIYEDTITQELELPQEVDINHLAWKQDYVDGIQRSIKQTTTSKVTQSVNFPLCLDASEAATIADILLYQAHIRRNKYSFSLPLSYIYLEPGDLINFPLSSTLSIPLYISKLDLGVNFTIKVEAVTYESSIYDHTRTIPNDTEIIVPMDGLPAKSKLLLIDTNLITPIEPDLRLYSACSGDAAWKGAYLTASHMVGGFEVTDNLDTFTQRSTMGTTQTLLPSRLPYLLDTSTALEVVLDDKSPSLESIDDTAFYSGAFNLAVVGKPNRWEIIRYKTATLIASNTYRLTTLIRGDRGTEHNISNHLIDDDFIQLKGAYFGWKDLTKADIDREFTVKVIPRGDSTNTEEATATITYKGNSAKPFSPVHLSGYINTSNDWELSWIRRDRKATPEWSPYGDIPNSEIDPRLVLSQSLFQVDVLNGSTVVRTIFDDGTSQATYSAAQQTSDFGSLQSTITFTVYQLSDVVGKGYPATKTIAI